ncbi:Dehydrodolichyl diphosphate synthase complex subunit SPAC4D7.04c [Golovinomyces cichoracearum]|uniref:Alkyl transferase n=1 Tax=Golovinomyces cichoracearum TaxID=62708 RepID=A0A420IYQ4_9PEZI|nr:Dehydrodolichyl diphosphate synthase complex subunit SPAC4D7.04c [Golovinomyces cichoracearum]
MPSAHLTQLRKWFMESPPIEWGINQLRELLIGSLSQGPVPQHIAFVMDGNRRFARLHQIETVEGHHMGFEALARILEICYKSGVRVVTVYAFSIENFKRSKYEVDALMEMAKIKLSQLSQHGELLERYGACIRVLGQKNLVKPDVLQAIQEAEDLTKNNGDCVLNICFPYTSRDEITTAIRKTVEDYCKPLSAPARPFSQRRISQKIRSKYIVKNTARPDSPTPSSKTDFDDTKIPSAIPRNEPETPPTDSDILIYPDPEKIDSIALDNHMFTANNPPVALLIRTSGVKRLSDFMLWQCHENTEIVFLDCLWPEFDLWSFLPVLIEWQWKQKQLGENAFDHAATLSKYKVK